MSKPAGIVLIVISLISLGLAVEAQIQLRKARAVVDADLSGSAVVREVPVSTPAAADTGAVLRLQQQVESLQAERDQLRTALVSVQATLADRAREAAARPPAPAAPAASATNQSRRAVFEERLAQLKRDDPARFEEMQKQREEFNKRIQTQADERSEFLKKIDTAAMTDEQRANHEKLVAATEAARALLAQMATLSPEEASTARRQMFESIGNISELYQQERRYLLEQTGRAMGYTGAEAGQFADYVQQIYDQTAMPRMPGGNRGRDRDTGASGTPGVGATPAAGTGGAGARTTPAK
jgi:hypothetical protein